MTPIYTETAAYAKSVGELDLYRVSLHENKNCKNAIDKAISENFDGFRLKKDCYKPVIEQFGLASDAHAGHWHRQVSFLAAESIQTAQHRGLDVHEGDFGENLTTQGINLLSLPLGTQLKIGNDVLIEISQIGKVCHTRCAIYYLAGDCIFPHEGIFGVVLRGGEVHVGDDIQTVKLGDGTCSFTPAEALEEVEQARREGAL